jgi:hypothetical protein
MRLLGNPNVRPYLNRRVVPRLGSCSKPIYILWTSTRNDMTNEHWTPNHFVPLLPGYAGMIDVEKTGVDAREGGERERE